MNVRTMTLRNMILKVRGRKPLIPSPQICPPVFSGDELAGFMNIERGFLRMAPLDVDQCLRDRAEDHAIHMDRAKQLTHERFAERLTSCGKMRGSENVAAGQTDEREVIRDWMRSPGHRMNILGDWNYIGTARSGNYWCAIFSG